MTDPQLIACPACGATNRVPTEQLRPGLKPVCGRCKTPLGETRQPAVVTDATFAAQVEESQLPVLVDLWAPWCGPCRAVAPIIEQLAGQFAGRVRFAKLNVDDNPQTAARFRVSSIPSLLIFKGGREVDRIIGAQPKSEIERRLRQYI